MHRIRAVHLQVWCRCRPQLARERLLHDIIARADTREVGRVHTPHRQAGAVQRAIVTHLRHPAELFQPLLAAVVAELRNGAPLDVGAPLGAAHRDTGDLAHHVVIRHLDVLVLRPHLDGGQRSQHLPDRRSDYATREGTATHSDHRLRPERGIDDEAAEQVQRDLPHQLTQLSVHEWDQHPTERSADQQCRKTSLQSRLDHDGRLVRDCARVEGAVADAVVLFDTVLVESERQEVLTPAQDAREQERHLIFTKHTLKHTQTPTLKELWEIPRWQHGAT